MRFLSVAERELRAAARQKKTYRLRWIAAGGALALLVWLGRALDAFANRRAGPMVFQICSVNILLGCLLIGAMETADCISREKRDGTLGLLFLTNLNSAEIVAGKLCSEALALIYPLLAVLPILALPVLLGGITFGHFWRTVLALVNATFFAMAAGFTASAVCVRQFPAVAAATGLALFFGTGLAGVGLSPMVGHLFAWLWTGLAIHALVLYYGAIGASPRLAEDKQNGALELILSTPTTERSISRGLWMAYGRRMAFPVLVALLVHLFFLWQFLTLVVVLFYSYQNSQSRRRWAAFQKDLKQRAESIELAAILPAPLPATQNFAQAPAFQNFLTRGPGTNLAVQLLDRAPDYSIQQAPGNNALTPWTQQRSADFDQPLKWIVPGFSPSAVQDRRTSASAVRDGLNPLRDDMAAVVLAAQLPFFQATTNRDPAAVFQTNSRELVTMQRLHFVFVLRASALLALNRETEAFEEMC